TAGLRPSRIMTAKAIENALRVLLAIGGSTNAIIHLTAIAGRVGVPISLKRLNELSDSTPVLVDLKPTGQHYMSDLHAAGGVGAVLRELKPLLHLDCLTVTGDTLGQRLAAEPGWVDRAVVRPLDDPYQKQGGLVALFGSLAPGGAILKRSAADPALFEREGRALDRCGGRRSRARPAARRLARADDTARTRLCEAVHAVGAAGRARLRFRLPQKTGADSVNPTRITGVLAPVVTPFKSDLSPD